MSSEIYDAQDHIFYNETGNNVFIRPMTGQTLSIEANINVGSNKQVIYNNAGTLAGSNKMTFDGSELYVKDIVSTENIYGSISTDAVGYNEIYRGTSPASLVTTQTSDLSAMGTDVIMCKESNRAFFACPKTNLGGVSFWHLSGTFQQYTDTILGWTTPPTPVSPSVKFCASDETGSLLVIFDGSLAGSIDTYDIDTTLSFSLTRQTLGLSAGRIYGSVMFAYDYNSNFKVFNFDSVNSLWVLSQTLMSNGLATNYSLDYPIAIHGTKLAFSYGLRTYVYENTSGTWNPLYTILTGSISLDLFGAVLVTNTTTDLRIFESGVLQATFSVTSITYCCTNGTYVFCITSGGVIRIYRKVSNVWTVSVNTYTLTNGRKMSCNANYLTVGKPTVGANGECNVFQIIPYVPSSFTVNTLDLVSASNQIEITANSGVKFSTVTDSTSIATGSVQLLGGLGVTKSIWATSYNSPNGAFKLAKFIRNSNQAYVGPSLASVLFNSTTINEIPQLSYTSGTGTFSVNSASRLLICVFLRYFSATNCSIILRDTTNSLNLATASNSDGIFSNPGCSFTTLVSLASSTSFVIQVYANTNGNVIGGAINDTYITIYSLN